jgi:Asp-tRNA(Asn)/Glu-tRNA(Gln) amidotransferase A subunit family amidase
MSTYLRFYDISPSGPSLSVETPLRFSIKDIFSVAGNPCSFGLHPPFLENATTTSPFIKELSQKFKLIGAVNLSPLCLDIAPSNPFYGDGSMTPAQGTLYGSSFGCVLSLMTDDADMRVDFSIGSDSGGSIRAPAAGADLYGMRLKSDAVSKEHSLLLASSLDGVGVLTKDLETMERILATILTGTTPARNRLVYIPHEAELVTLSEATRRSFDCAVSDASKQYTIEVCDKAFFHTCFEMRKQRMRQALRSALFSPQVTPCLTKLPQAHALRTSLEQHTSEETPVEQPSFDQNALLLHPTLTEVEPLNLFLPAANLFDLYSLSLPMKSKGMSICISGCNYTELLAISKLLTNSGRASE